MNQYLVIDCDHNRLHGPEHIGHVYEVPPADLIVELVMQPSGAEMAH